MDSVKTAVILQHVLPKLARQEDGNMCFNPTELLTGIKDWVERNQPDEVIVTYEDETDERYPELNQIATKVVKWKWVADFMQSNQEISLQLGVPHGDFVHSWSSSDFYSPIYQWMKDLQEFSVITMGGFQNECLEGLENGLDKLHINYKRHSSLIY